MHAVLCGLSPAWIRRQILARSWMQDRIKQDLSAELLSCVQNGSQPLGWRMGVLRDAGCSGLILIQSFGLYCVV